MVHFSYFLSTFLLSLKLLSGRSNVARIVCDILIFSVRGAFRHVFIALDIAYQTVNQEYEIETLGPDVQLYSVEYAEATYNQMKVHNRWHHDALMITNNNIEAQHRSMRQTLVE